MSKPFFYRIVAAEFIAEVLQIPTGKHKEWVTRLALDLVSGDGSSEYSRKVISEVSEYRKKQAEAGAKGGKPKHKRPLPTLTDPIPTLEQPLGKSSNRSSNRSSNSTETESKPKVKRFVPPSVEEVTAYMAEIGFNGDAHHFVDHYTGNGWKVGGKAKMVDWQATVRTWRKNNGSNRPASGTKEIGGKKGFIEANGAGTDFLS